MRNSDGELFEVALSLLYFTVTDTSKYNWRIGSQSLIDNGFEINKSSTIGGSSFTSPPILVIDSTGIITFAKSLRLGGDSTVGIDSVKRTASLFGFGCKVDASADAMHVCSC